MIWHGIVCMVFDMVFQSLWTRVHQNTPKTAKLALGKCKQIICLQKWPIYMLVQNISRGHKISKTIWNFGAPYCGPPPLPHPHGNDNKCYFIFFAPFLNHDNHKPNISIVVIDSLWTPFPSRHNHPGHHVSDNLHPRRKCSLPEIKIQWCLRICSDR